jgi:hypothetical protein
MMDGTHKQAIELMPGKEGLMAFGQAGRPTKARVIDQKVETHTNVVELILANGQSLLGTQDQLVALRLKKLTCYRPMGDILIGDSLKGERAGMPVTVNVIGIVKYPERDVRLVGLTLDHEKNFVAESVLCR